MTNTQPEVMPLGRRNIGTWKVEQLSVHHLTAEDSGNHSYEKLLLKNTEMFYKDGLNQMQL